MPDHTSFRLAVAPRRDWPADELGNRTHIRVWTSTSRTTKFLVPLHEPGHPCYSEGAKFNQALEFARHLVDLHNRTVTIINRAKARQKKAAQLSRSINEHAQKTGHL